jgi:hypothetical protein
MLHLIKQIKKAEPFRIDVLFNTGEVKTIDLKDKLLEWSKSDNSKFKELLNPEYFVTVRLNTDLETIYWDNGIDFCPDTLFHWSEN